MTKKRLAKLRKERKEIRKVVRSMLKTTKGGKGFEISKAPVSYGVSTKNKRNPMRSFRLQHREFIRDANKDVSGDEFVLVENLAVNPGLDSTFPWLSAIARNFERYVFHKLSFFFVPTLGTQTSGKIMIAPDYDAADDNTTLTKAQFLSFEDSITGPIWKPAVMRSRHSNFTQLKSHYVRTKTLDSNLDIKTYDVANVFFGTSGYTSTGIVGELWVEYDITFYNPQLSTEHDAESYQYERTNVSALNQPFAGTGDPTIVNGGVPVTLVDATTVNLEETGKFLLRCGAEVCTAITAMSDPTSTSATITPLEKSSGHASLGNWWGTYVVDAVTALTPIVWTGLTGTSANNFFFELIRLPSKYASM